MSHSAVVGKEVRLGKKPVKHDDRTLLFSKYVKPEALPPLPIKLIRSTFVPSGQWGMLGNDNYGDCTIAAAGHAEQLTSAVVSNGQNIHQVTTDGILADYWATGSPPTPGADDNGRVELDVLNYWRNNGITGSKIAAYTQLSLDQPMHGQVRQCLNLFGFCYLGIALPITAQTQKTWKVVKDAGANGEPGSWGGHAVVIVDYDWYGPYCITWGERVHMTWSFFHKYVEEAYAVILQDWFDANGKTIQGFDLSALESDLSQL